VKEEEKGLTDAGDVAVAVNTNDERPHSSLGCVVGEPACDEGAGSESPGEADVKKAVWLGRIVNGRS